MKLTHDILYQWKNHEYTKEILKKIRAKEQFLVDELINGNAFSKEMDKPGGPLWTSGVLFGINLILNIEPDEETE